MPRFFFDTSDGLIMKDEEGTEFANAHLARDAAIMSLPDIAREEMIKHDSRAVVMLMRDESGRALFTASLTLTAKWLVDNA